MYRLSVLIVTLSFMALLSSEDLSAQTKTPPVKNPIPKKNPVPPKVVVASKLPITGKAVEGWEPLDKAIQQFMETISATGATVAVSHKGELVYSRGFGWSDKEKTKPTPPDAYVRTASITKPMVAAAIRAEIKAGKIALDTKVFPFLGIKPYNGKMGDSRLLLVTVEHLLTHKGGWDSRKNNNDPMFRTKQIEKELKLNAPATGTNIIEYMLAQPLDFAPGEKEEYSNFGFCVLGRVLEKIENKPFGECMQTLIFTPGKMTEIQLATMATAKRPAREIWYPVPDDAFNMEVLDANGGFTATAPTVCEFLNRWWINGDLKIPGSNGSWVFFGSMPGNMSMIKQRPDEYNICVLLNQRRNDMIGNDTNQLSSMVEAAMNTILKKQ